MGRSPRHNTHLACPADHDSQRDPSLLAYIVDHPSATQETRAWARELLTEPGVRLRDAEIERGAWVNQSVEAAIAKALERLV